MLMLQGQQSSHQPLVVEMETASETLDTYLLMELSPS
jgi:hypothetical protein